MKKACKEMKKKKEKRKTKIILVMLGKKATINYNEERKSKIF